VAIQIIPGTSIDIEDYRIHQFSFLACCQGSVKRLQQLHLIFFVFALIHPCLACSGKQLFLTTIF
jgi:hypothetical protein